MEEISAFRRQLETHRPADWETLPDFPLYMDQVLSYMERQTIRLDESDALTASMVNNYTKNALVPRAEGGRRRPLWSAELRRRPCEPSVCGPAPRPDGIRRQTG